jgi:hypothetical protein
LVILDRLPSFVIQITFLTFPIFKVGTLNNNSFFGNP